jgi:uncharacterized protein YcgL (UPF0745 family)
LDVCVIFKQLNKLKEYLEMSNTSQYIPYESVAPIMLENPLYPEYPFFSGTGFFLQFPPYDDIFLSQQSTVCWTIKMELMVK